MLDEHDVARIVRRELGFARIREVFEGWVSATDPLTVALRSGGDVHITDITPGLGLTVGERVDVFFTGEGYRVRGRLLAADQPDSSEVPIHDHGGQYADNEHEHLQYSETNHTHAQALTHLASVTPVGSASFNFTSIPGTYKHLMLRGRLGHDGTSSYQPMTIRVNNRATNTYASVQINAPGDNATADVDTDPNNITGTLDASWTAWLGNNSTFEMHVPNYADSVSPVMATAYYFSTYGVGSQNGIRIEHNGMRENGALPVTRLDFALSGQNFRAGSLLSLYGVD